MKNKKLKKLSLINLITGYLMLCLFMLLVLSQRQINSVVPEVTVSDKDIDAEDLFNGGAEDELARERFYVDAHPVDRAIIRDRSVGVEYGHGVVLDDERDVIVTSGRGINNMAVVDNPGHVVVGNRDFIEGDNDLTLTDFSNETHFEGHRVGSRNNTPPLRDVSHLRNGPDARDKGGLREGDSNLLDRRLLALEDDDVVGVVDLDALDQAITERDKDIDNDELTNLTLAKDGNADFDLDIDSLTDNGAGSAAGGLYAYNYPSQGVGAGIGSPAVGAGVGAAGLGAGIGEAVLDGNTVPALGGIGTSPGAPLGGAPTATPPSDGVGGLACGAGAGGAAGLTARMVNDKLGLGAATGKGCREHGEGCEGHHGHGNYDYDHLPPDAALHIMMHVDGSGSILHTRKQLEIMRESLLKEALLPYYNNDEELYERRVTIVDGSGERTLRFFTEAAEKANVLALVFQDEAQPVYHLPNFNRKPEEHYLNDLTQLKSQLQNHAGLYRGVLFQVDRGKTFAKSFKEFVECALQGKGYLENHNLKKYYWEENNHHIKNKDGIVFSDVYHAKDQGNPQYYLDLIFKSAQQVGLDLNIYGAGLKDGQNVKGWENKTLYELRN